MKYKSEMETLATSHKEIAVTLTGLLLPIEQFIETCKKEAGPKASALHDGWKKHQIQLDIVLGLEAKATEKVMNRN